MAIPTRDEVNAAARHIASFLGGLIVAFGLTSKLSPDTVNSIVTATGALVNDALTLFGIVAPLVAAYFAKRSATPDAQAQAVVNNATAGILPRTAQIAVLNAAALVPGTEKVVNPAFAPDPATAPKITVQ